VACATGFVLRGRQSLGQSTKQHGEVFLPNRQTVQHVRTYGRLAWLRVLIAPLKKVLDAHRGSSNGAVWIFQGTKNGFALNLDNLTGREIRPVLGDRWHGWHAFRRGIATVLFGLAWMPKWRP
jgi:hypothetical protein